LHTGKSALQVQLSLTSAPDVSEWILNATTALPTENNPSKGKGKAIPLQAWAGPEGSRKLRLPDFKTIGT